MSEPIGSLDLHTLGDDGLRRNGFGQLLVIPPGGSKPVGYSRVTTIAKATDEGGGLAPWKAAMSMTGLVRRPGLAARWEALVAEHGDPWYASAESKKRTKALVEEASEAGGATDRRDQGDALHSITALVDRGEVPRLLSVETQRDIGAYLEAFARHGIEVVPGAIETTVVLDSVKVAGTFDRLVTVRGFGDRPLVADLKTGSSLDYSDGAFAIQLAAYAHGEAVYRQGPTPAQDRRAPMPAVDQATGLVIWLPAGEARCEVRTVDLEAGWRGFELALEVRAWRRVKTLAPLSDWAPNPARAGRIPEVAHPEDGVVEEYRPMTDTEVGEAEVERDVREAEVRDWLQARIDVVGAHPAARHDLSMRWPVGVGSLRGSTGHSIDQLAAIEDVLDKVEAVHSIPFGPPKPGYSDEVARRVLKAFPGSTIQQEEKT